MNQIEHEMMCSEMNTYMFMQLSAAMDEHNYFKYKIGILWHYVTKIIR